MAGGGGGGRNQRRRSSPAIILFDLTVIWLSLSPSTAEITRVEQPAKNDGSVSLLVVGDWGRRGGYNQSRVAAQMGRIGSELDIDFVISTGDNFYDRGLKNINDPVFALSFKNIYTAPSLHKPWYAVLGNHDYHGDVLAQLAPVLREMDRRWICMRSFIVDAEVAEFFFLDTTPFVLRYWTHPGLKHFDWRGVAPREAYISSLLSDLEEELRASQARWKIVVGHHAIRSASIHGDTSELVELLLPVLKANDVDLYINGHDHCLEHISSSDSPIQFLTSGGGSKAWRGVLRNNEDRVMFFYDGQGFLSMKISGDRLELAFHGISGEVLHRWSTVKSLYSFI
ncbi:purple acid phosphatase 4-like [Wolffia australiana]